MEGSRSDSEEMPNKGHRLLQHIYGCIFPPYGCILWEALSIGVKQVDYGVRQTEVQILALPRSQGKFLFISVPQFPHLHEDNNLPISHDYCEGQCNIYKCTINVNHHCSHY